MRKEDLETATASLAFTAQEQFKVEQTNELIEMIDKLRMAFNNGR